MKPKSTGEKIICVNKKAGFNFFIEDKYEAGIVLTGTEVKSLRAGKANLTDAYAMPSNGELFLHHFNISAYSQAGLLANHEPVRKRKLLLHRQEINKMLGKVQERGYALVPTRVYFKNGRAKVEIALARGKTKGDQRDSIKERDANRDIAKALRRRQK